MQPDGGVQLMPRVGECNRCGKCCQVYANCEFLIFEDGKPVCKIYENRPQICQDFPQNPIDIKDFLECGYKFVGGDPVETRYMRSDYAEVNGLNAYILGTSQTTSSLNTTVLKVTSTDYVVYCGIRVWKRNSAGVETEITAGEPVAVVSRSVNGEGIQSNTWDCPQTALSSTDTIVVRVYLKVDVDAWQQGTGSQPNFQTEQLGASQLDAATWTVYYYTVRQTATKPSARTGIIFHWGTSTYNSRVENFVWTEAAPPPSGGILAQIM